MGIGDATLRVVNTLMALNEGGSGAAILVSEGHLEVVDSTLADNTAESDAGAIYFSSGADSSIINDSILWGNASPDDDEIHLETGVSLTITYSDIAGGWSGTGNINSDPDFVGGDRIIVFDNRNLAPSNGAQSRILELNAATGAVSIHFQGAGKASFFTDIMGKQQLLPNGNLLVTVPREGRVLEVAPDGALLWEYNNVVNEGKNGWLTEGHLLPASMDKKYFARLRAKCALSA